MTTCTIVGLLVACLNLHPLSPAAAARIVEPGRYVALPQGAGPTFVVIDSTMPTTPFPPPRRLDGSLLSDPPWQMTSRVNRRDALWPRPSRSTTGSQPRTRR